MRLKDILVHLDATEQGATRLRLAADLARRQDAHLIGLFVADIRLPVMVTPDPGGGAILLGDLMDTLRGRALAEAAQVEAAFQEALRREGIAGECRQVEGMAPETVALHARYADLAVIGQADPGGTQPAAAAIVEATLFSSGRPVLVVPYAGWFERLGERVLIGWNASREASRAVHDALPVIAGASAVTVLSVDPRGGLAGHGEEPGADIARHLARHGLKVAVEHMTGTEIGPDNALQNRAAELSADLLVMGAYGHSRIRELMLGGVTRTLLREMTVPVLLSH
jgi:nucleotide-binding universal stress UspA family protein